MALTITSRPDDFCSAYLPVEYKMTSSLMPNSVTGESQDEASIYGFKVNQTTYNDPDKSLQTGQELFIRGTLSDANNELVVGQYVLLQNAGIYNGVHRITEILGGNSDGSSIWWYKVNKTVEDATGINESDFNLFGEFYAPLKPLQSVTVSKWYNNYSAVADLYISGNFVARFRRKVDLNDEFVFDFSTVLQEYLGSDLATLNDTTLNQASTDLSKVFRINYAEEYDVIDDNAVPQLTLGSFVSDAQERTAVNSVIPYIGMNDFVVFSDNYNLTDYFKQDTGNEQKFLTNQPYTNRIGSSDHYALSYIIDADSIGGGTPIGNCELRLYVRTYNSSGATIATNQTVLENDTLANLNGTRSVLVGTSNLGAWITSETVKYDCYITLYNVITGNGRLTEIKEFEIDRTCYRDEFRFEWLNKLGGVDGFTFTGKYDKTSDIDKETFKRTLNASRTIPERQLTTLKVMSEDIHTVNSGIVNKSERDWLEELLESPEVYLIKSGYRLPVQVDTKFGFEKLAEDSYNVTLEFILAFDKVTQRN